MPVAIPITFSASATPDVWALNLSPLYNHTQLITSYSDGTVKSFPIGSSPNKLTFQPTESFRAHPGSINSMRCDQIGNLIGTAAADGVKVWDLRCNNNNNAPVHWFKNDRGIPFLSLDFDPINGHLLAGGTELKQSDSELHIWDLRTSSLVRSYIDSHHDDITEIRFHPLKSNYLLSGSTDGYVNIYDLNEAEEEDSLFQVINGDSVHSAGWLSEDRIYTLSHMETFSIHQLNDLDNLDSADVVQPTLHGDIREAWGCEYVVDVYPGYIAMGSNSNRFAKLHEFTNEKIDLSRSIDLNSAHGEEVVRDVYVKPGSEFIFSAGEDGNVKVWKNDWVIDVPEKFCQEETAPATNTEQQDVEMVDAEQGTEEKSNSSDSGEGSEEEKVEVKKKEKKSKKEKKEKKEKREKKEKKEKKDKKEKKEKKESKSSKKDSKKEKRFKPY